MSRQIALASTDPDNPIIWSNVVDMYQFPDGLAFEADKPRGRGKLPTHPIDRLRTRLWVHVVMLRSGLSSGYAVEKFLYGDQLKKDADGHIRVKRWSRYQKGLRVPDDQPGPGNVVDQAERRFPGTAMWFRSPLWPVLRGEKCDRIFVEKGLRQLSLDVKKVFFEEDALEQRPLSPQKPFGPESKAELLAIGGFDALAAAVLLVALSEDIASPMLREMALNLYLSLQPGLKETAELKPFYPELFSAIDERCKHWVYLSPNERFETVVFWQEVPDNGKVGELTGAQIDTE